MKIHSQIVSELENWTPLELFSRVPNTTPGLALLLSDHSERWSILTAFPRNTVRFDGRQVCIDDVVQSQSLSEVLNRILHDRFSDDHQGLPFVGGLIGSVDYEYGLHSLDIDNSYNSPYLVYWNLYNHALLFDHQQKQWLEVGNEQAHQLPWKEWITRDAEEHRTESFQMLPRWDFERYQKAFDELHQHIVQGDVYQACLTFPFEGESPSQAKHVFQNIISKHAAPMSAYLKQNSREILSFSPERFLQWNGKQLETKPIKGTILRGLDSVDDQRAQHELLQNKKEEAELNMITDLLRNDLAKVSVPGSVQVLKHRELLACPGVWHTYSHIRSTSKPGLTAWDILHETFPGGSISGCPKRRAVEILRELEENPRGVYTGCIGYISDHGTMDLNIAIRSFEQTKHNVQAGFGGGIVFDSVAQKEYEECFAKTRNLVDFPLESAAKS